MAEVEGTAADQELEPEAPDPSGRPLVVGIGASAGGLAALRTFFSGIPENTGFTFVVVVHLSPEHESHLADLLQPHARMPVQQVSETTPLESNHVYVIPPGANLSSVDTHLRLSRIEERRSGRTPIDYFFRSLAESHGDHSVGLVLTGTGSDGALGIKAIKEKNGFTLVQDPADAEYDGMPRSAIATGLVDQVLPLAQLPDALLGLGRTAPRVPVPPEDGDVEGEHRLLLQKIFAQVRARTGRDFTRYKRSTLLRRIRRRMQLRQVEDLAAYLELLRTETDEARALADDALITVTNFFRDPLVWQQLETEVIPTLFEGKAQLDSIRAWSVGCATGEEAYSLAMLLMEEAARRGDPTPIQVFASDLHEGSLDRAREGFYPGEIETDVTSERLRRFFQKENGGYRVIKEVREKVVFAPHNILADPPFSRLDLVSCRNVLIYLQRPVQRDIVELFHYALRPDGALVLGTSETLDTADLFRVESKRYRIYRKRDVPAPEPRLPAITRSETRLHAQSNVVPEPFATGTYGTLHQRLLDQHGPPSMLVAPDGRVVHLSARAGRFLVIPGGEPTTRAHRLVREELRGELRAALHAAREKNAITRTRPIPVRFNGDTRRVVLDVRPSTEREQEGFCLVVFEERDDDPQPAAVSGTAHPDARTRDLEAELNLTKQRLQATVEEYETTQEEMRSSHEELQSSNEELRSALEELETSREELQTMNEELQTVNEENRQKVEELSQLSGDLQNLLTSSAVATLFLDRHQRILRFTPQVGELFNMRAADRGRPLSDLTHRLGYPQLRSDAEAVLRTLIPVEREVRDERGRCFLTRVLPYRSAEDRIEGVVITFLDITQRLQAEEALRQSEARLRELNATLEQRVAERTAELEKTNHALTEAARERERAEQARRQVLRNLATAEEAERRRISRELHDQMGQIITGLLLGLKELEEGDMSPEQLAHVVRLKELANHMARDIQQMATELRPPALDNLGLRPALKSHLEEWSDRHGIEVDFHASGVDAGPRLAPEVERTIFRVVQEGLTNVLKHAGATRVSVLLERGRGAVRAILEDDGHGFDVELTLAQPDKASRLGIRGMRERVALLGGDLDIESSPGGGTTLFLRIPDPRAPAGGRTSETSE